MKANGLGLAGAAVSGGIEVLEQLLGEWQQLADQARDDHLFWRPEWILASLRAYSPAAKLLVVTVRRRGELRAILPLVEERCMFAGLPARKLRPPMTTPGAGIEILCAPDELGLGDPVEAIWELLRQRKGWDVLELPSVFQGAAVERLVQFACKDGHSTGSWPLTLIAFLASPRGLDPGKELEKKYPRHPKLRSKVKQREAKLAALGTVRLRRVETAGSHDLQCFYEMEARGWKGREKSAIISDPRSRQFFDGVVSEAERLGYLCLYLLEIDGKPIAAHIGFIYKRRYWAAKSTYDEDYRDYDPGHLIVKAILRDLVERGISEYVMGVREDWKMEWTQDVRRRSCQCVFARGLWARALYTARFPLRRRLREIKILRDAIPAYLRRLPVFPTRARHRMESPESLCNKPANHTNQQEQRQRDESDAVCQR